MDWATVHARRFPGRWVAVWLGLVTGAGISGCGRTNPFLRDEPPMLGTLSGSKTDTARTGAPARSRLASTGTGSSAGGNETKQDASEAQPKAAGDTYAQSFNRTRPRPRMTPAPAAAPARAPVPEGVEPAAPAQTAAASESGVRTTALDPTAESAGPSVSSAGISLRPPVSLTPASEPQRRPALPAAPPAESASPSPDSSPGPGPGPGQAAPATLPPAAAPGGASARPAVSADAVVAAALGRLDGLESYQVSMNRQERVGESLQEPEDVLLSIRRNPRAIRLQWTEGPHQGREVIYSEKETAGMMQVNLADASLPMPRLALAPNSPLALRNSRHPITEAGLDTIVRNIETALAANRKGDPAWGRVTYAGLEQPAPLDHPCHKLVRVTPAGETWQVFFDPESKLPTMVQANAANGDLLERYIFRAIQANPAELAAADAFDPNQRWGESKGLLQRLARAAGGKSGQPETSR